MTWEHNMRREDPVGVVEWLDVVPNIPVDEGMLLDNTERVVVYGDDAELGMDMDMDMGSFEGRGTLEVEAAELVEELLEEQLLVLLLVATLDELPVFLTIGSLFSLAVPAVVLSSNVH